MTSPVTADQKERLSRLFIDVGEMTDKASRDRYVAELSAKLGRPLSFPRAPEPYQDVFSLVNACLVHPGSLRELFQIVAIYHPRSYSLSTLEQKVAEVERMMPPTHEEFEGLVALVAELPLPDVIAVARSTFTVSEPSTLDLDDARQAVGQATALSAGDPLTLLGFVDTLAHVAPSRTGRDLHGWVDRLGDRLFYGPQEIRNLCLRSRDKVANTPEQQARTGEDDGDNPAVGDPAEDTAGDTMANTAPITVTEPADLLPIWGGVPIRNPHFTGRESLMRKLREELNMHSKTSVLPQTLQGFGGVGKTQLAMEYAYRYGNRYDLVWWIPAERATGVLASLARLGEVLKVAIGSDLQQTAQTVLDTLARSPRNWLLVYDNADRPEEIVPLVPTAGGHVILTSRNAEWSARWRSIEVNVFTRSESVDLLGKRGLELNPELADRLAEKLGDLPLALEQAINYQLTTKIPIEEYLRLLDERVQEILDEGKPTGYSSTVTAFVTLAVKALREANPAAAELLELFAFLGPEPISAGLMRKGRAADLSRHLKLAMNDSILMNRMVRELPRYGLAKVETKGQRIQVHRLVQAVIKSELDPDERSRSLANVRNLLGAANPGHPDEPENAPDHAELGPHVVSADLIHAETRDARMVVLDQARYLFQTGDYAGSRRLCELMVREWQASPANGGLGRHHEQTLQACRHLANALRMMGEYDEARRLDEETLALMQANPDIGNDHEYTVWVAFGIGFDLRMAGTGDLVGSLEPDRENAARANRVYGPDHDQTLQAKENYAAGLRLAGRFEEAYELSRSIAEVRLEYFGYNSTRSLWAVSEQVRDLYGLGRYRDALEAQERVWDLTEQLFAQHQRQRLLAERNLVIAYRKTGDFGKAVSRGRDNHLAFQAHFGPDHEYTLASGMSLANALRAAGRLPEARDIGSDVVNRYRAKFGERHWLTLAAQVNYGIILRLLGERRAAKEMEHNAFHTLSGTLGENHFFTLCAANNYASNLSNQYQIEAARALVERTLDISRRVRGDSHPDTLACAVNAAMDNQTANDDSAAQHRLDAAIDAMERELGSDHPTTIDAVRGKRIECDIEPPPT